LHQQWLVWALPHEEASMELDGSVVAE
jgi:hypothetical protein